jgi:hypothetical protein
MQFFSALPSNCPECSQSIDLPITATTHTLQDKIELPGSESDVLTYVTKNYPPFRSVFSHLKCIAEPWKDASLLAILIRLPSRSPLSELLDKLDESLSHTFICSGNTSTGYQCSIWDTRCLITAIGKKSPTEPLGTDMRPLPEAEQILFYSFMLESRGCLRLTPRAGTVRATGGSFTPRAPNYCYYCHAKVSTEFTNPIGKNVYTCATTYLQLLHTFLPFTQLFPLSKTEIPGVVSGLARWLKFLNPANTEGLQPPMGLLKEFKALPPNGLAIAHIDCPIDATLLKVKLQQQDFMTDPTNDFLMGIVDNHLIWLHTKCLPTKSSEIKVFQHLVRIFTS